MNELETLRKENRKLKALLKTATKLLSKSKELLSGAGTAAPKKKARK
jgi:hypothetical protein